jgi:uncharacterized protein YigA (DUF484 family)
MTQNPRDAAPDSATGSNGSDGASLAAAQVAAYLRRNPGFLADNPSLLDVLEAPARRDLDGDDDRIVDLQQAMVERLREEVEQLRRDRDQLLATGRSNLAAQARVHLAVVALLSARSFEHLIETVTEDLAVSLNLDSVTICVEKADDALPAAATVGVRRVPFGTVDGLLGVGRDRLLLGDTLADPEIFGPGSGLVRSFALLRLEISEATPPAMLAFGSREADHFDPHQGSELLTFVAEVLARLIRAWLDLPE